MNHSLQFLITALTFLFLCSNSGYSQVCINNPSIQQGNMTTNSGSGVMSFSFFENLLDYTDEENDPVRINVCFLNTGPKNGATSVSGSFAGTFDWQYDPASNCLLGTQNQDILGGSGGLIEIEYSINFDGSCSLTALVVDYEVRMSLVVTNQGQPTLLDQEVLMFYGVLVKLLKQFPP